MSNSVFEDPFVFPEDKTDPLSDSMTAQEVNDLVHLLEDIRQTIRDGELRHLPPPAGPPTPGKHRYHVRSTYGGRLEISENGGRWRRVVKGDRVYDIREYGARPGQVHAAGTGQAIQAVLDEISHRYPEEPSGQKEGLSAVVFFPFDRYDDENTDRYGWWTEQTLTYTGSVAIGLRLVGEHGMARGGGSGYFGSSLVYGGDADGVLLDLQAVNGTVVQDLQFDGRGKARILLWLRHKFIEYDDNGETKYTVKPSDGVRVHRCVFHSPQDHEESALVAAGKVDKAGQTFQAGGYRFYDCYFSGSGTGPQGWGFRAMDSGNTKNFTFSNCQFANLYRGVEASSGYVLVNGFEAAGIGGFGRPGAVFYGGGNTWNIIGGGLENGQQGYAARLVETGGHTKVNVMGVYIGATPPADDYIIRNSGALTCVGVDFEGNSRSADTTLLWEPGHDYAVGDERQYDGNVYRCVGAGTSSAAPPGPTRTSSNSEYPSYMDIPDGTAHWMYLNAAEGANVLRLQHTATASVGPRGGAVIQNCSFQYNLHREYAVPLHDGSNNHIGGHPGPVGDYSRIVGHRVQCTGNTEGLVGTAITEPLADVTGDAVTNLRDCVPHTAAAVANGCAVEHNSNGLYVVTVPHTAFKKVKPAVVIICQLLPRTRIRSVLAEATELFAAPTNPIQLSLGVQTNPNGQDLTALLLPCRVDQSGPQVPGLPAPHLLFGQDPAELGPHLAAGVGYVPNFDDYQTLVLAELTLPGDATKLTSGSVTFHITFERLHLG